MRRAILWIVYRWPVLFMLAPQPYDESPTCAALHHIFCSNKLFISTISRNGHHTFWETWLPRMLMAVGHALFEKTCLRILKEGFLYETRRKEMLIRWYVNTIHRYPWQAKLYNERVGLASSNDPEHPGSTWIYNALGPRPVQPVIIPSSHMYKARFQRQVLHSIQRFKVPNVRIFKVAKFQRFTNPSQVFWKLLIP